MYLADFDFTCVIELPKSYDLDEVEGSMRLLGAAEFATAILSLNPSHAMPVTVDHPHWHMACAYYLCGAGAGQGQCIPPCLDDLQLWHITVFPGYIQKLTNLGYRTPQDFASDFATAFNALSEYMLGFPVTSTVVNSGALKLQALTWLKRFETLNIPVNLDGLEEGTSQIWIDSRP